MSPNEPPVIETARERELRRELMVAYEQMTAITSRLLLANESSEASLSGDDRTAISDRFLRTVGLRRAALAE